MKERPDVGQDSIAELNIRKDYSDISSLHWPFVTACLPQNKILLRHFYVSLLSLYAITAGEGWIQSNNENICCTGINEHKSCSRTQNINRLSIQPKGAGTVQKQCEIWFPELSETMKILMAVTEVLSLLPW